MNPAPEEADWVLHEVQGRMGFITLNRPQALNALSLSMIRSLSEVLTSWRDDPQVLGVAVRGMSRDGAFGSFCAGGDIRFFHRAAGQTDASLEDFFTEEYQLNHLIHTYPKPYIVLMDGVVMGGGMGISQGGSLRVVTERTRMAMPETGIGLFPDVGGGFFLSRCPGRVGEYLALTGAVIGGRDAVHWGLADGYIDSVQLPGVWDTLRSTPFESSEVIEHWVGTRLMPERDAVHARKRQRENIDRCFAGDDVAAILQALEATDDEAALDWVRDTLAVLRTRSPLMLAVVLRQIRLARRMSLSENLRMERGMMWHCFHRDSGGRNEALEGIRALVIDKDHQPRWQHANSAEVPAAAVDGFFASPWSPAEHPLAAL